MVTASILGLLVAFAISYAVRPPSDFPTGGGIITVTAGQSLKSVGTLLEKEHYIRSRAVLATLVTFLGGEHRIAPGDYFFPRESALRVARQLASGEHNLVPIKVTIPEGSTADEINTILAQKLPNFSTDEWNATVAAQKLEGYLFPETYFFFPHTSVDSIVNEMHAMFGEKTAGLFTPAALGAKTENEIVTMASLIELEAHGDDDRTTIAGILYNRLRIGMPLQVDASTGTYHHVGLPATPIANPGLAALDAALHPAKTDYLYYLHDSHGTIHYAKTYAEHVRNIALYLRK